MHRWTRDAGVEEKVLLTKSDKVSNNQISKNSEGIAKELGIERGEMIACSVVTKRGIDQVRREIAARL
jgi:GTP-binding protein EngB required for normal cell division